MNKQKALIASIFGLLMGVSSSLFADWYSDCSCLDNPPSSSSGGSSPWPPFTPSTPSSPICPAKTLSAGSIICNEGAPGFCNEIMCQMKNLEAFKPPKACIDKTAGKVFKIGEAATLNCSSGGSGGGAGGSSSAPPPSVDLAPAPAPSSPGTSTNSVPNPSPSTW